MADFRAIEWSAPAAPPTFGGFDIDGTGLFETSGGTDVDDCGCGVDEFEWWSPVWG